jgi:serine/threonine protein kinase
MRTTTPLTTGPLHRQTDSHRIVRVEWALLSGDQAEMLLSMLLCNQMPNAVRLKPGQGDDGIDVFEPGPHGFGEARDVYQVKRFTGSLTNSQKRQITRSLTRVTTTSAEQGWRITGWNLVVPIDPTTTNLQWFSQLTAETAYPCQWIGLTQCNMLVAKYPSLVDYWINDSRAHFEGARHSRKAARRFGDRWERVGNLGEGGQAHTFLVRDLTDGTTGWVLKRLKNKKRLGRFQREIESLTRLRSPHIPAVVDSAVSEALSYLVTPYVGKDLTRLPDVVDPKALLELFRGIVVATHDAHAQGIIHRDIKPNNVTVDENGKAFLVDFGICAEENSDLVLTTTAEGFGNRSFAPPECDAGSVDRASPASDVYSLGKLLYWMASGRKLMVREDFDKEKLTVDDPHAAQYVSVFIHRSVLEDPGARWTTTDFLQDIDWALEKLKEHSVIRESGLMVLDDGFGPNDECYEGGSLSATSAPRGSPPAHHDVAQSFFVREPAALDQLDIGVKLLHGSGRAVVVLVEGGDVVPSDEVIENWEVEITERDTLQLLRLPSTSRPTLGPSEVYWVILSPSDDDSEIAWISAAAELMPRLARFAERDRPDAWQPRVSVDSSGQSLRVLARAEQS